MEIRTPTPKPEHMGEAEIPPPSPHPSTHPSAHTKRQSGNRWWLHGDMGKRVKWRTKASAACAKALGGGASQLER